MSLSLGSILGYSNSSFIFISVWLGSSLSVKPCLHIVTWISLSTYRAHQCVSDIYGSEYTYTNTNTHKNVAPYPTPSPNRGRWDWWGSGFSLPEEGSWAVFVPTQAFGVGEGGGFKCTHTPTVWNTAQPTFPPCSNAGYSWLPIGSR